MKLHYTYGQPSLTVKKATVNSYMNWNGKHNDTLDEAIKNSRNRLKGTFNPRMYLGHGRMFKFKDTWKGYDFAVKKLIAACVCDYMAVKGLGYNVEIDNKLVKVDIDTMLFNREEFKSGDFQAYRKQWNVNFDKIIDEIKNKVVEGWKDNQPSDEIKAFFGNKWQIYGIKRQYKNKGVSKTYKYMDGKDIKKIAKYLASSGITEVVNSMKERRALARRGISIKEVNEAIAELLKDNNGRSAVDTFRKGRNIISWINSIQPNKLDDLKCIKDMANPEYFLRAYGFDISWKCNGYVKFIGQCIEARKKDLSIN